MKKLLVLVLVAFLYLTTSIFGCQSSSLYKTPIDFSPVADFVKQVDIIDAYCLPVDKSKFRFNFSLQNLLNIDIEAKYYWTLNEPAIDFQGFQHNVNDPQARMFQGQGTLTLSGLQTKNIEIQLSQDKEYDARFYVMYVLVYNDDVQVGYYRGQKSTYDWDYSTTPPSRLPD